MQQGPFAYPEFTVFGHRSIAWDEQPLLKRRRISLFLTLVTTVEDSGLTLTNPLVLGPVAGFIFAIFVYEVVVSGRAYKREQAENTRLREVVEAVIPLAEKMVAICERNTEVLAHNTEVLNQITGHLAAVKARTTRRSP